MFKLVTNPTFKHVVKIMSPIDGGHQEDSVTVTYRVMRGSELANVELGTTAGSTEFLRRAVVSVDGVQNEAGEPLIFSDQLRDQLIDLPHVRTALAVGYAEGVGKAKTGN